MSDTNVRCTCFDSTTAGRPWCPVHDVSAGAPEYPDPPEFAFDPGIKFYPEPPEPVTLRDYFAGQALVGWMANPNSLDSMVSVTRGKDLPLEELAAIAAYHTADAMIAERERDR